jgi:TRAP-type uncharacterized transport system substrate-binding protein
MLGACGIARGFGDATVYSPAPPSTPLHRLNLDLRDAANGVSLNVVALALPDSINTISDRPDRALHLPIVTTADFKTARAGLGPAWHSYPRPCTDLRFVAKLYDVGLGLQTIDPRITAPQHLRGKRVGAPARPSAVRWLTEALLADGWGIADTVVVVDLPAGQAIGALKNGEIDATSWNLVMPNDIGFASMLPSPPGARFLEVDDAAIERMTAVNGFALAPISLLRGVPPLLSFAQAVAAWDSTDATLVTALLDSVERNGARFGGLPDTVSAMADWPGLTDDELHPAARAFYRARGVRIS